MSQRTKLLGAVCGLAAGLLMSGPASAGSLMGFAGTVQTDYQRSHIDDCDDCEFNDWNLGATAAGPLSDIMDLNVEVSGAYGHNWRSHDSAEVWDFDGNLFWAGEMARVGVDGFYTSYTHFGYAGGGGVFGEYYFNQFTAGVKAGWLQNGGTGNGGNGEYAAIFGTIYAMPDLAITGGVDWNQSHSGYGFALNASCGSYCSVPPYLRTDYRYHVFGVEAEYLVNEDFGASIFASFVYGEERFALFDDTRNFNVFRIGLKYYTGGPGGSLVNRHRNGNLHPWLRGSNIANIQMSH